MTNCSLNFFLIIAVHCWDYRAYIVKKANIDDQEELEFTYDKIANNFSNYSSWRYRSQLLTRLRPGNSDLPIERDKHNEGKFSFLINFYFLSLFDLFFRT